MTENMKILAIVTRVHPQRPNMLRRCEESVRAQIGNNYVHILLRDDKTERGYGIHNANQSFVRLREIPARYVMVLDDDDMLIDDRFVEDFSGVLGIKYPPIVFLKGIVHKLGVLPRQEYWEKPPVYGQIASFCFAVRQDVWFRHIQAFGDKKQGGDYCFIRACYDNTNPQHHLWWDRIVARTQAGPGRSKGEKQIREK